MVFFPSSLPFIHSVFAPSSQFSGYKNCLTVINHHHHHLRASPSYSAAPSTEDQGYSWRNVVVSELITNKESDIDGKSAAHFLWLLRQITMLTLTEIRSGQAWFRWNCLGKYLQNMFNSLFLGFVLAVCLLCSSVVHHVTWQLTNKPTSTVEKKGFYYRGTGREQLPAST